MQTIVDGDEDHVLGHEEVRAVGLGAARAARETSSVHPEHHGPQLQLRIQTGDLMKVRDTH